MDFMPSNTYDKPWLTETITMPIELKYPNPTVSGNWALYFNDLSLFDEKWMIVVSALKNNNLPDIYQVKCSTNYVHSKMEKKLTFGMIIFNCCFPLIQNNIKLDKDNIENRMMVIGTNILNALNYTDRRTIFCTMNGSVPTSRNHTFKLTNHLHSSYNTTTYLLDDDDGDK